VFSPLGISIKDAKEDAFAAGGHGEGACGTDASLRFDKELLDHIGRRQ
jgi:hypothetical protein